MSASLMRKIIKLVATTTVLSTTFLLTTSAFAQQRSLIANNQQIDIPSTQHPIVIDGELTDRAWQDAVTIELDIVNYPWNNRQSPVKTTAKMVEDGEQLYISFVAEDPEPENIQAILSDRDTTWYDDIVGIKIDPQNNRRTSYDFFVNPYGVQNDQVSNEITGNQSTLWDGIWDAYGKITDQGYQVEMAIPFSILKFEESSGKKYWAFELSRQYPRDTRLRISHVPLDRNNACWLCQYPVAVGFENAKVKNDLTITPAIVAGFNQQRDVYSPGSDWQDDQDFNAGVDIRWGIDANTLINATINPDFSTVEADAGQLNVNTTYSLFYDEKRPFFLENADYFDSQLDLVYTRNIADPDYGAKLTGTKDTHTYGAFFVQDTQTNFLMPGNLSSELAILDQESHSGVLRYRYDYQQSLSIGAISTLRKSDGYHNYVAGFDAKYRLDDNNTFKATWLGSSTQYPNELYQDFCYSDDCSDKPTDCSFGNCGYSEQVIRAKKDGEFSDDALTLEYTYTSEFWDLSVEHENIGVDFRADLGFINQVDHKTNEIELARKFFGTENTAWQEAKIVGEWKKQTNQNGELIAQVYDLGFEIDGPMQSLFEFKYQHADRVGLRMDDASLAIDGNTELFTEKLWSAFASVQVTSNIYLDADITFGDKIDYTNNRLGELVELGASFEWYANDHLKATISYYNSALDADNSDVYDAQLFDTRLTYQFDVYSYLRLSTVYEDVKRNQANYLFDSVNKQEKNLVTQLIYAYKLNPQTVFFLGYSDNSFEDDELSSLERDERTLFTKISYAWR
ncbi:carbohydrate binding family 9 domain-containing protein [Thalassotalea sp. LPB0316]|uniref:carbohydrate binding family 9 domain-containing protein n=1 Tax=Thalassotalea sp. LPB0316 TaxID=2769490 RepID=UPI0018684787|nr:carbohydrate binding family 9 domain-containing protein [Thalassotalea sp. LPB0316]QOL25206.1 carbohydrate binding family 9 domain-containing protein [Thalassotalea sp. LPB0316]